MQQETIVSADGAGNQHVTAVVTGNVLQRFDADVLRLTQSNCISELVDLTGNIGDKTRAILDAVSQHHERVHIERSGGCVQDSTALENTVADRRVALGSEAGSVDDVFGRVAIDVRETAIAELKDLLQRLRVVIEPHDAGAVAFQHHVNKDRSSLLQ